MFKLIPDAIGMMGAVKDAVRRISGKGNHTDLASILLTTLR